ncbi:putative ABC multidrug transporter, partial [Aureobasidium melanogenum]
MPTSSPYMAISYPFLAVLLYFVQKFYLRTARQLRLLDLEAKSPLYTHFLDTAKGISTARAFGFISEELNKNVHLVNDSQRPAYLLVMVQQWLNLVLDIVVMIMAAVLTTLAVRTHSSSGFTGASLVTLMSFGENLSGIVIFYTKLETSIGAIARLRTFNDTVTPEDKDGEDIVPSLQWPETGSVCIKGVSASYCAETSSDGTDNLALKDVSLTIDSGKKIAICGRTGSGKSSLIALFLKLLDPTSATSANISIDALPLQKIERSTLRQRLLAVPQEAVFLPDGTSFKENLDPLDVSSLQECQHALESVGMWDFVLGKGGLTASMSAGTLSAGQRQLLSLARVLLRRRHRSQQGTDSGILLLDEVSSSVDQATEKVMQEIIKTEFERYTVVAVSHRLDMIMDFDSVVVMDKGCLVEVGNPRVLAMEAGSRFEIDPVNVVLGLMALLVSMTMLVMKVYKQCRPHGRRNRRHHMRRRTDDVLPTHEPPRKRQSQHGHSGQSQQNINNGLNAGYYSRHATLSRSRRSPHSNSTTPQPQAVANSTTTPATVTSTPTSALITSNGTPTPVISNS